MKLLVLRIDSRHPCIAVRLSEVNSVGEKKQLVSIPTHKNRRKGLHTQKLSEQSQCKFLRKKEIFFTDIFRGVEAFGGVGEPLVPVGDHLGDELHARQKRCQGLRERQKGCKKFDWCETIRFC